MDTHALSMIALLGLALIIYGGQGIRHRQISVTFDKGATKYNFTGTAALITASTILISGLMFLIPGIMNLVSGGQLVIDMNYFFIPLALDFAGLTLGFIVRAFQ